MKLKTLILILVLNSLSHVKAGQVTSDPADNQSNIGQGNILVAPDDNVTFYAESNNDDGSVSFDPIFTSFGNGTVSSSFALGGEAMIVATFGQNAAGQNDCLLAVNHTDPSGTTCSTDAPAFFQVYVANVVFAGNDDSSFPSGPSEANYIDDGVTVGESGFKISTKVVIYNYFNGLRVSNLSTVAGDGEFTTTDGVTTNDPIYGDGIFTSIFSTTDNSDPVDVSFLFGPTAELMTTSQNHQMLPAMYKDTFTLTGYFTPNESQYSAGAVTSLTFTTGTSGHSNYIQYNVTTVSAKSDFVKNVVIEGEGYLAPTNDGGSHVTAHNTTEPGTSNPKVVDSTVSTDRGHPIASDGDALTTTSPASCAIVRNASQVIPDMATLLVGGDATRKADDTVDPDETPTAYHIDLYFGGDMNTAQNTKYDDWVVLQSMP